MTWWRWAGLTLCLVILAVMAATHPDGRPRGRWWADDAPTSGPITWSLLRWVWPLTGWWSRYRYIRPPTP